jgi:hypothetical protein
MLENPRKATGFPASSSRICWNLLLFWLPGNRAQTTRLPVFRIIAPASSKLLVFGKLSPSPRNALLQELIFINRYFPTSVSRPRLLHWRNTSIRDLPNGEMKFDSIIHSVPVQLNGNAQVWLLYKSERIIQINILSSVYEQFKQMNPDVVAVWEEAEAQRSTTGSAVTKNSARALETKSMKILRANKWVWSFYR